MERAALVILCGGRARRMGGRPKALLAFADGTTILDRTLAELAPLGDERWLSATAASGVAARDLPVVLDDGRGPAHALAAAARAVSAPWIVAVGCDQPALDLSVIRVIGAVIGLGVDAAVARADGRRWPMPGWYRASALAALPSERTADASLQSVLDRLGAREVALADASSLVSVNTPHEAARAGLVLAPE